MNSINTITLTGRCGSNPEIRYFDDGNAVARLRLAINRRYKGEDEVFWVDASIWGKSAQNSADYVKKGTLVAVSGRVEPAEAWVDKNGNARAQLKVSATQWEILSQPGDTQPARQPQGHVPTLSTPSRVAPEDLPF